MKRYIPFAFAFALGWLCLESGQALTAYDDTDTVTEIPLAGRCAHDGYNINYDTGEKLYEYSNVKDEAECKVLCEQWALCQIWTLDSSDAANKKCILIPIKAFTVQELTKLRISGVNECPRSDGCIFNDRFYQGTIIKTEKKVADPFECQIICEDTQHCSHFTWSMDQSTQDDCYLYKGDFGSIASGTNKVGNKEPKNFVSGGAECDMCFLFHRELKYLERVKFPDGSVHASAETHTECQEKCNRDHRCKLFEWWTNDKRCYMFNPFTNLKQANNVVTGLRNCDLACGQCDALGLKDPSDKTCDRAGNCKCKANYVDPLCKKCATGYTRASDGSCTRSG